MPSVQQHDEAWLSEFRAQGYTNARPLAAGMEGAVYRLDEETVAKVWADKGRAELTVLQHFYDDLASEPLPFNTPQITRVYDVDGTSVTHELVLHGRPLQEFLAHDDAVAPAAAIQSVATVLGALASTHGERAARELAVLDVSTPFRGGDPWPTALATLIEGRVAAFGDQLSAAVPEFRAVHDGVLSALESLPGPSDAVIHGDICGVNILVDDDLSPTALLDWGFLSTAGDPVFDAAVAAGIFNMYGPHAQEIEHQLAEYFAQHLDCPPARLLLYRAAYALVTSNAYDPTGQDGHFEWCASTLRRGDVRAAVADFANSS
jgi:Ser/Thr protein kinase RdoA (MazF antagonist)